MVKVLIEFVVSFIIVYLFYYFFIIKKCKKNKKIAPAEVNLILSMYEINIKKIDLYKMIKEVSFITTFILSLIITTISEFFDNTIIVLIFGTLMSVLIAFICYRMIGKRYERISNEKTSKNKND